MAGFKISFAILFASLIASSASAEVVFMENSRGGSDGELSGDNLSPTSLGLLTGEHTVIGQVSDINLGEFEEEARGMAGTADIFSFDIAPGTLLTSIILDDFVGQGSGALFMSIDDEPIYSYTPNQINSLDNPPDLSLVLGGQAVGDGQEGTSILSNTAGGATSLGPGVYTVYIQETTNSSNYQLTFNVVSAVPEPSSAALCVAVLAVTSFRRRRR